MGVAVVIPVHNDEATLADAVASALEQGATEVVVVDDGSTDGSADLARGVRDPRVSVFSQSQAGPGAARNAGAARASATALVFLDSDDALLPGSLAAFDRAVDEGASLVRAGAVVCSPDGTEWTNLARFSGTAFPRGTPMAGSFAIRRDLFNRIGGYDPEFGFGENSEMLLRAQLDIDGSMGSTVFLGTPTVRVTKAAERDTIYYRDRRLAAIERMLSTHGASLGSDREALHNHHAIAANLYQSRGNRRSALRHATAALRLRPSSAKSWGRLLRTLR